ncbi:hypothetical protein THITH_10090 [Thioalkalivibrio paradoxus ARh 1]|uniref:Glycosyltransferase subfamily 4-like N-terminal domain-containing protein n=1 Tax=Thioalkalivibrio paradoxus ARh 1 TaxID=713585 RepID=W0DTC3_9GAMM|nr:hypothetical protein THITH_10090 [Thioalkalivibrio paradoxus ARh 1]
MLGVIDAFREMGWTVDPYVVGDRVPVSWIRGSGGMLASSLSHRLGADIARFALNQWHARRAWRELRGRCDWVYERAGVFQALGRPFSRAGIPWIVESNAPLHLEGRHDRPSIGAQPLVRRWELGVYRDADAIVTVSATLRDILSGYPGVDAGKILVVPNGVDTRRFDPERVVPQRFFPGPTIGFVGTLFHWQWVETLLSCVAELRVEGAVRWSVVIAGQGPQYAACRAAAERLALGPDAVRFLGQVPWSEVPAVIAGTEIGYSGQSVLHGGAMYNSPLKIYEYMAMGKPVLASAFEDAQRSITHGETGFLFRGGDRNALKQALREAWHARDRLKSMGRRARQRTVAEHGWEQRVRAIVTGVADLLERRPA